MLDEVADLMADSEFGYIDKVLESNAQRLSEIREELKRDLSLQELAVVEKDLERVGQRIGGQRKLLARVAERLEGDRRLYALSRVKSAMLTAQIYGLWSVRAKDTKSSETLSALVVGRNLGDIRFALKSLNLTVEGEPQCLFTPGNAPLLTQSPEKRSVRFKQRAQLLEFRVGRRNEQAARLARNYEDALQCGLIKIDDSLTLGTITGKILPWTLFHELAGNQLYQSITEVAVKLRDEAVNAAVEQREAKKDAPPAFCTIMDVNRNAYYPIGDTSRHILAVLQKEGLRGLTTKLYARLAAGAGLARGMIREHIGNFLKPHTEAANGRRITLCLIWIRSLNANEMDSVEEAGIDPDLVSEKIFGTLNSAKRNPHHVTTVQMAIQLRELLLWFNNPDAARSRFPSPDAKRYFVPVFIGDPMLLDQYRRSSNVYIAADAATNLVHFWKAPKLVDLGAPHNRYRQFGAIKELFHDERFDLIQIGIRSGIMEQGMYQGAPTIYVEEEFCPSGGDRMVSLSWEGPSRALLDNRYRAADDKLKRSCAKSAQLNELRANIDEACPKK